jgi:hypothetical protein
MAVIVAGGTRASLAAKALAEGTDREMVADHQGGRHQGGMNDEVSFGSWLWENENRFRPNAERTTNFCDFLL